MEFRCDGRLAAKIVDGELEVKCRSARCGARSGVVVLHYFNIQTGALLRTSKYKDPAELLSGKVGEK